MILLLIEVRRERVGRLHAGWLLLCRYCCTAGVRRRDLRQSRITFRQKPESAEEALVDGVSMKTGTTSPTQRFGLPQRRPSGGSNRPPKCTIKSLLVPLDFSRPSGKALEYALAMMETCGAQLHLAHICDYDGPPADFEAIPLAVSQAEVTRRSKRRLKDVAAKYGVQLEAGNFHVVSGRAYHEICRLAENLGTDLIVISTRGHTGLKHVVLGSTTERVVQHAPCPVLVVREHEREIIRHDEAVGASFELSTILVPLDFSECSFVGLEYAIPWAHFWNATLVLFHSIPLNQFALYGEFGSQGLPMADSYADEAARGSIRDVASRLLERGVAVETEVEAGPPVGQICEYAERKTIDLIITSTHGATGFRHVIMGSTAEHVVRYAHCPVLVVPTRQMKGRKNAGS